MTTRLRNINPLQLGLFMAVFYLLLGIIVAILMTPFFAMMATLAPHTGQTPPPQFGFAGMLLMAVIIYPVMGFIGGILSALIYNLVAGWTGGIEMTFTQTPITNAPVV